jgi:hypothetical protein
MTKVRCAFAALALLFATACGGAAADGAEFTDEVVQFDLARGVEVDPVPLVAASGEELETERPVAPGRYFVSVSVPLKSASLQETVHVSGSVWVGDRIFPVAEDSRFNSDPNAPIYLDGSLVVDVAPGEAVSLHLTASSGALEIVGGVADLSLVRLAD